MFVPFSTIPFPLVAPRILANVYVYVRDSWRLTNHFFSVGNHYYYPAQASQKNTVNKFRVAQVKWQRRCWRRWIVIDFSPEWWYLRRMLFFVESKVYYMTNPKKIGGIPMVRPFHMLHWGKCCWSDASLYPFSIQHSHCVRIPHSSATM